MFVQAQPRLAGFLSTMIHGSLAVGKTAIPVAAAVATGGAAAGVVAGAGQTANIVADKKAANAQKKAQAAAQSQGTNFLSTLPKSTLVVGGLSVVALVAVLARR